MKRRKIAQVVLCPVLTSTAVISGLFAQHAPENTAPSSSLVCFGGSFAELVAIANSRVDSQPELAEYEYAVLGSIWSTFSTEQRKICLRYADEALYGFAQMRGVRGIPSYNSWEKFLMSLVRRPSYSYELVELTLWDEITELDSRPKTRRVNCSWPWKFSSGGWRLDDMEASGFRYYFPSEVYLELEAKGLLKL
jgi:hypothetical protein